MDNTILQTGVDSQEGFTVPFSMKEDKKLGLCLNASLFPDTTSWLLSGALSSLDKELKRYGLPQQPTGPGHTNS